MFGRGHYPPYGDGMRVPMPRPRGGRAWKRAALGLLGLIAAFLLTERVRADPAAPPLFKASKIILIGDSTTQVGSGWGGAFCADHVTAFLACVDLARCGRSSGSYIAEGAWALALAEMKVPYQHIWVVIQFGHNDQPGKPGRSTDLATEFPANLRRYVTETRAAGAIPVLVTPLTRRTFQNGRLQNDLVPWADAVRRVAHELDVPLLDLNAESAAAVQAMGEAGGDTLAQLPKGTAPTEIVSMTEVNEQPFAQRKLSFDRTHLGRKGADYFAAMVARELSAAVPDIRRLIYY